ncbi:MAG: DUF4149 domain-containing protein [Sideroxydans sp.]|nr:DUF4149 domain-containing protein [Sideroxydans sp.]
MLKNTLNRFAAIALTLWVGGLLLIGYLVVPVLFHSLPDKQLAGSLAGEIFHVFSYVALVCGALLWGQQRLVSTTAARKNLWLISAMLLLSVIIQFGLSPLMAALKLQVLPQDVMHSVNAAQFKLLHGVSSFVYLLESGLGVWLLLRRIS